MLSKTDVAKPLKLTVANEHPLVCAATNGSTGNPQQSRDASIIPIKLTNTSWNGLDPLSQALTFAQSDVVATFESDKHHNENVQEESDSMWKAHKAKILNKFNTGERLSFYSKSSKPNVTISQKVKTHLEQLDESEDGVFSEMLSLSQQEYVSKIEEMKISLTEAWHRDQKVKSLKIAIQSVKQLSSTNVICFYPSKFILITDILSDFGQLVYQRIFNKMNSKDQDVSAALETCRNWFYKVSSIRELLPRFYIEVSILKIYSFLFDDSEVEGVFERILERLTNMINGVGNPLVAIYCRAFLCSVAMQISPQSKHIFKRNIVNMIDSSSQVMNSLILSNRSNHFVFYSL